MEMKEAFRNPSKEYRGAPFWSWNDDLEDKELVRQMRLMKEGGLGGFFMHSRVGLLTPYMSAEWMARIKTCVGAAKRLAMDAWLYDEDRWPSGFAGGVVPRKGKAFARQFLQLEELPGGSRKVPKKTSDMLAMFTLKKAGEKVKEAKFLGRDSRKITASGDAVAIVYSRHMEPTPYFNNQPYVDLLSPRVVKAFIDSTYEPYKKAIGRSFGKEVPGIFTDEPQLSRHPWTENLRKDFVKRFGYDIIPQLASLFYHVGDYQKVRHDYYWLITDRFVEAFSKQLYQWCEEAGLVLTGHYNAEDTLQSQISSIGAAMPHYEFQQLPGIDLLRRDLSTIATCKQVSSVAHQMGGRRVLSETFGASGWDHSLEEEKWKVDWQCVLGVDLLCQHLSLYSLKGERKRDYPPSIHYQQPWWKYHKLIGDYEGRLCYMLTRGRYQADVLVLHPIGSAWAVYDASDNAKCATLNKQFEEVLQGLCELHYDFDLGDETILARHGKVQKGKLRVGSMSYSVVVMPPSLTWRESTVALLERFVEAGGKVIAIRSLPTMVEASRSRRVLALLRHVGVTVIGLRKQSLARALRKHLAPDVKMTGPEGLKEVYYQHRRLPSKHIFFFANTGFEHPCRGRIALKARGRIEKWNLETGEITLVSSKRDREYSVVEAEFSPAGSLLLVVDEKRAPAQVRVSKLRKRRSLTLARSWQVASSDPNALTIDHCRYRIGRGRWSSSLYVLDVQDKLVARGGSFNFSGQYTFKTRFEKTIPSDIKLVLETPEKYAISVNGTKVTYKDVGWWRDREFKLLDIAHLVKEGLNTIELQGRFKRPIKPNTKIFQRGGVEVESCYVIGDFAVTEVSPNQFIITDPMEEVSSGDLVQEGFPFFAGTLKLQQEINWQKRKGERVFLELEEMKTTVVEVSVNGKQAGTILWHPIRVDVTKLLVNGTNTIELALTNSCRNLLGPHHHTGQPLAWTGPGEFRRQPHWTDSYSLVPFGMGGGGSLARYG